MDDLTYVGPDRRIQKGRQLGLRLLDRRRKRRIVSPPPLVAALRHLRVRVHDTCNAAGLELFSMRAIAVSVLASAQGRGDVSAVLTRLVEDLQAHVHAGDATQTIFAELDRAADLLG